MSRHWLKIIGGGLAGLSLCDELLKRFNAAGRALPGNIVLVESRASYQNDKTYSFFAKHPPANIAYNQYSKWAFSCEHSQQTVIKAGNHYAYYRVSAADVIEDLLSRITQDQHVDLLLGVDAQHADIPSQVVVDTRPCALADMWIKQSFIGVEVELPDKIDSTTAHLMSNMRMEAGCFTFDYILPLSAHRALVEVTQFSSQAADQKQLSSSLAQTLKRLNISVPASRHEAAILPMGLHRQFTERLASQQIRSASGYGYLETKRWAQQNARLLFSQQAPRYRSQSALLQWFDARLLKVIEQQPEQLPAVFMQMANRLHADNFASFMSAPSAINLLQVMAAVPKMPFLRTLYA